MEVKMRVEKKTLNDALRILGKVLAKTSEKLLCGRKKQLYKVMQTPNFFWECITSGDWEYQ
jgi:hypothetical protein